MSHTCYTVDQIKFVEVHIELLFEDRWVELLDRTRLTELYLK